MLTILMQAEAIKTLIVGPERKTVISLEMGPYQQAKKLQMDRKDLDHLILRPCELSRCHSATRTIGGFLSKTTALIFTGLRLIYMTLQL